MENRRTGNRTYLVLVSEIQTESCGQVGILEVPDCQPVSSDINSNKMTINGQKRWVFGLVAGL